MTQGTEAIALIQASSIVLVTDGSDVLFSTRNQLPGTLKQLKPGAVNSEVIVDIGGTNEIAAIITNESAKSLELKTGTRVTAIFKAGNVILCKRQ